jgi:hypothetical protein
MNSIALNQQTACLAGAQVPDWGLKLIHLPHEAAGVFLQYSLDFLALQTDPPA